jgi:hypothetical protein
MLLSNFILSILTQLKNNMRLYKFLLGIATIGSFLTLTSCEKDLNDASVNPNDPADVPPGLLLTGATSDLAYTHGGDFARFTGIFTHHLDGTDRQFSDSYQKYNMAQNDFNTNWNNVYSALTNLAKLKSKSDASGYDHYAGISRILLAFEIMEASDVYGAMPFSEAFQENDNLTPKFDSQEALYATCERMLGEALISLGKPKGLTEPGSDDFIYKGDLAKWGKFAHAIKARLYLHKSKRDVTNYAKALAEVALSFSAAADEARYPYPGGTGSAPMQQFFSSRGGYASGGYGYADIAASFQDTVRMRIFCNILDPAVLDATGAVTGGFQDNFSDYEAHPYFTANQALPLISFAELMFIKAECLIKTGGTDSDVRTATKAGIDASFVYAGSAGAAATYTAQTSVLGGTAALTLQDVITQKYLALFCEPEVFTDWRRTGFPALTSNSTSKPIPRRFYYPQNESDLNPNTPAATLNDRLWWDIL